MYPIIIAGLAGTAIYTILTKKDKSKNEKSITTETNPKSGSEPENGIQNPEPKTEKTKIKKVKKEKTT